MDKVKRYTKNTEGKDYIVGDIHGCFTALQLELDKIGFDGAYDRLFSVGDLVDRGPESEKAIHWIDKEWFHAVRGNHEQMAIDYITATGWTMDKYTYAANGGQWFMDLHEVVQQVTATAFEDLPYIIELETDNGVVGILHAECIANDWDTTKAYINIQPTIASNTIMWGRDKIRYKNTDRIRGIDHVVVGHTPQKDMMTLGNVIYIDTGAVFQGVGHFTIIDANTHQKVN